MHLFVTKPNESTITPNMPPTLGERKSMLDMLPGTALYSTQPITLPQPLNDDLLMHRALSIRNLND